MSPMVRARRGTTTVELLVAMPLALLVAALAVQLFVAQLHIADDLGRRVRNARDLEQAAELVGADLRGAAAHDILAWSDSALMLFAPVMSAVACDAPAPDRLDVAGVADVATEQLLRAVAVATPQAGDRVSVAAPDSTLAGVSPTRRDRAPREATLASTQSVPSACSASPFRTVTGTPLRLALASALHVAPLPGQPVTIARRTEWRVYRAGDGDWYLGRRDHDATGWTSIQPVIGPILSAAEGGFRVRALHADGTPLASPAASAPAMIALEFRMPRPLRQAPGHRDSLRVVFALRGGS